MNRTAKNIVIFMKYMSYIKCINTKTPLRDIKHYSKKVYELLWKHHTDIILLLHKYHIRYNIINTQFIDLYILISELILFIDAIKYSSTDTDDIILTSYLLSKLNEIIIEC